MPEIVNGKASTSGPLPTDDAELYAGEAEPNAVEQAGETAQARRLAERYRLDFVDLTQFNVAHHLFRAIPADLTLRYGFVPYRRDGQALVIVVSDPTDFPMIYHLRGLALRAHQS